MTWRWLRLLSYIDMFVEASRVSAELATTFFGLSGWLVGGANLGWLGLGRLGVSEVGVGGAGDCPCGDVESLA